MMFTKPLLLVLACAASVFAQSVQIVQPKQGQVLVPGQKFTVEILKPASKQPSTDIGVAITLSHDENQGLGAVLFAGAFHPTNPAPNGGLSENFEVTTPNNFPGGPAVLNVVHSGLTGPGPEPFTEIKNVNVNVK